MEGYCAVTHGYLSHEYFMLRIIYMSWINMPWSLDLLNVFCHGVSYSMNVCHGCRGYSMLFFNFIFAFFTANKFITIIVTQFFDPVQLFRFSFPFSFRSVSIFYFLISPTADFIQEVYCLLDLRVLSFPAKNYQFPTYFFQSFNINCLILNNSIFPTFFWF